MRRNGIANLLTLRAVGIASEIQRFIWINQALQGSELQCCERPMPGSIERTNDATNLVVASGSESIRNGSGPIVPSEHAVLAGP